MDPIQIYLGTEIGQWLPSEVLKHSIRSRTKRNVQFHEVRVIHIKHRSRVNLGLNFHRYFIPEVCQFKGRAIYLDAQSLCFGDIEELDQQDMKGAGVLARKLEGGFGRNTHVLLFDCAKLSEWKVEEWIKKIDKTPALLREYVGVTSSASFSADFGDLPPDWNQTTFTPETKLLNFDDPFIVPWKTVDHPAIALFKQELLAALADHQIPKELLQQEIAAGHVTASLIS